MRYILGVVLGLDGDNGKENGNSYVHSSLGSKGFLFLKKGPM